MAETTTLAVLLSAIAATLKSGLAGSESKVGVQDAHEGSHPGTWLVFPKGDRGEHCDGIWDRSASVVVYLQHIDDTSETAPGQTELLRMMAAFEPGYYELLSAAEDKDGEFGGLEFNLMEHPNGDGIVADGFDGTDRVSRIGALLQLRYKRELI